MAAMQHATAAIACGSDTCKFRLADRSAQPCAAAPSPAAHLLQRCNSDTGTYPHKHRGFYVGAPLGGVLAKALTGSGSYLKFFR